MHPVMRPIMHAVMHPFLHRFCARPVAKIGRTRVHDQMHCRVSARSIVGSLAGVPIERVAGRELLDKRGQSLQRDRAAAPPAVLLDTDEPLQVLHEGGGARGQRQIDCRS